MKPTNINTVAHQWMDELVDRNSAVIDATIGNGHDTLFLAERARIVYGFDIQQDAIAATHARTSHLKHVRLFCDNHRNMDRYVLEPVDLVVFNLGYLPGGDKSITTLAPTTMSAIEKAISLLKPKGALLITFYIGHENGKIEHEAFLKICKDWPQLTIERQYTYESRNNAPILYCLRKHSEK